MPQRNAGCTLSRCFRASSTHGEPVATEVSVHIALPTCTRYTLSLPSSGADWLAEKVTMPSIATAQRRSPRLAVELAAA